ncbi:hypothetical protein M407DRAFT_24508 [Tulasnella calospora MUT 4182]|uniref:DUF6570 domain-containing protein n=1 Tax=Tulasnella calospora MUT 4182 TaxID=1051891 RepID=A0A0C3Q8L4_9AGAM|nr:hypothetical protein M407DRAFT_24508 [Tulasnella calospora MUT 4182]
MPLFALANNLFRGSLPDRFQDLTWVEEMVCSTYRMTAHVTRLYQSSNPGDLLGSFRWFSSAPVKESALKYVFRIRKSKVWDFLLWLKVNNPLYKDRLLSLDQLALYDKDGCVPGLEDATIVDNHFSATDTFPHYRLSQPAPPQASGSAPSSPSKRKAEDQDVDFMVLSPAPKRPFPATPSRPPKAKGPSTPESKPLDGMILDESPLPATQASEGIRKTSPSTPSPAARLTRAGKAGAASSTNGK